MKKYFVLLMLISPLLLHGQVKNLDRLPQPKRDSVLVAMAKAAVLKYGPDYYGETTKTPTIVRKVVTKEEEAYDSALGFRAGRVVYHVGYPYDREYLEKYPDGRPYCIEIRIWEDSVTISGIMFRENGLGFAPGHDPDSDDHFVFVPEEHHNGKFMMRKSEYEQRKTDYKTKDRR